MPVVSFNNVGTGGLGLDIAARELPIDQWSYGQNVRFRDGAAQKFQGHEAVYDPPTVAPYWLLPVPTTTTYYWLYAGLDKVYVADGTNHTNITRQTAAVDVDYTGSATDKWNGGIINGIPFLNNGVDAPQMWSPVSTSQKLQALTGWPASTTCAALRAFKGYLVALDVTKSSTRYDSMVKWSDLADSGTVPASWDEADATLDAGETSLAESGGACVDCLPLRDTNIIYREGSTWAMQYVGGQYIFSFYQVFPSSGILARDCVASFEGKHIVLTQGDLIVHDGHTFQSIVDQRTRNWLFSAIDPTYYAQSYIAPNYAKSEMWVCFPSTGNSVPDTALVWNWRNNTFGLRDLPAAGYIASGVVDPAENLTWASDTETWAADVTTWDQRAYNPADIRLLMASPTNTKLYMADQTEQFDATAMTSYVERTGLTFGDISKVKRVRAIWPRITAENGTTVSIYVGQQMEIGDSVTYSGPYTFTVGTDKKVDTRVTGRLIAVKFVFPTGTACKLTGYDIELEETGKR